jgi:hypothetical protein
MVKIITFEPQYRDDMLFCFLSAKDALGRVPALREDLLDIQKNYFDHGDMFYLAIDDNQRVYRNRAARWLAAFYKGGMTKYATFFSEVVTETRNNKQ